MPDGIFHDAHEVYAHRPLEDWQWVATFATRDLADSYVQFNQLTDANIEFQFEVRPV